MSFSYRRGKEGWSGKGAGSGHVNHGLTPENVLAIRVEIDIKADTVRCLELLDLSNQALVLRSIACRLAWMEQLG